MSFRDDFYLKEATLVNRARRELANGVEKDPIDRLRLMCFTQGVGGILNFARTLHSEKNDGKKVLTLQEFKAAVDKSGLECSEEDIMKLFHNFNDEYHGGVNVAEFLMKLRPTLSRSRMEIIEKAFSKADPRGDGFISLKHLKNIYNVKDHPKYLSGELTEKDILCDFLKTFDNGEEKLRGKIYKEDFVNYYCSVSASIDRDAYFDLVMRRAYKL
ncbi:calcyphosin-like protein [Haematobia irritans]|uniref:calcyphosin-like protein n=1 Tax=Haematobia irritans TaxID=7368 RepID=UPI003F4F5AB7